MVPLRGHEGTKREQKLLVGVDEYPALVPRLRGCVNDVTAAAAMIRARVEAAGDVCHLRTLADHEAIR
jgi:hypothetical protein